MQKSNSTDAQSIHDSVSLSENDTLNETLIEIHPFPVSITSMTDKRFLMVNSIWCKMGGFTKEDVIGRSMGELGLLHDPADRKLIEEALARDGEVRNYQIQVPLKGIPPKELSLWIKKIRYRGQDCALTMTQFVSPEIEKQQTLRENEMRFHTLLNNITESYYEVDLEGRFTYFNESLASLFGETDESLLGKTIKSYTSNAGIRTLNKSYEAILSKSSKTEFIEFELHRKDGGLLQVEASISPLRRFAGSIAGYYGIVRDRTSKKMSEEALRRSEEKHRRILEEMEEGYYEIDLNGNLTSFNAATIRHHGYSAKELMGMNYRKFLIPDQAKKVELLFKRLYETGESILIHDYEILRKDGSIRLLEISGYPLRNPKGRIIGFWGITRDRTEQKRAEMALQKSEEQYRLLVNNANDAIYITQDGRIKYHNPKTLQITGYSEAEITDLRFVDLVHPEDKEAVYDVQHHRLSRGHVPEVFAFRLLNKARALLWVELNAIGISWEGRPATLNFLRNVTQLRKTENQLLQAQKMEAIGTLAGGVAHDFNNILSAIIGYSELALDDAGIDTLQRKNLNEVLTASHRARDLVHQILAFARQTEENRSPVIVNIIAKEALKLIRSSLPSTIEIQSKIVSKSCVMGNATQVHQIIMNLCTNAAHAMDDAGGTLTLSLTDVHIADVGKHHINLKEGDYLQLTVSDTGSGIAPEIVNNIFDPYFTTKELGEGTGMGLSVVEGIVENYGGQISVESRLGEGSIFTVYLPICSKDSKPIKTEAYHAQARGERIFLVDDESAIVEMISQMLEKDGYQVTTQTDSLEALKQFASKPDDFDMLITDMTMPYLTGDRLASEILRIRPGIPVMLCTGYSKKIDEEKAREIGIKSLIYKPINRNDLCTAIRKILDNTTRSDADRAA